jgi:hypothetical protein
MNLTLNDKHNLNRLAHAILNDHKTTPPKPPQTVPYQSRQSPVYLPAVELLGIQQQLTVMATDHKQHATLLAKLERLKLELQQAQKGQQHPSGCEYVVKFRDATGKPKRYTFTFQLSWHDSTLVILKCPAMLSDEEAKCLTRFIRDTDLAGTNSDQHPIYRDNQGSLTAKAKIKNYPHLQHALLKLYNAIRGNP